MIPAVTLQACLNGARSPAEHPGVPVEPTALADAAAAAVAAGAEGIHLHPRDGQGLDTLDPERVAAAVTAARERVIVEVGVTTGAWTCPDPGARLAAVGAWRVLPDAASVNWHEDGAEPLARLLLERGVAVEAGVWTVAAATAFLGSPARTRVRRILVEATEDDAEAAILTVTSVVALLQRAGVRAPLLVHGENGGAWPVLRWAAARGHAVRVGLEDAVRLPDGEPAPDNAALVAAARSILDRSRP